MNLIQLALQNIKRGPITTIIGALVFILSVVALALSKITFGEFIEGLGLSLLLLACPDPNGKTGTAAIFLAIVIALLCLVSCIKPSTSTSTKTEVKYRDTSLSVPGDKVSARIDGLYKLLNDLLRQGKDPKIVYRNNPESPTNLTFRLDDQGGMHADCITDSQFVRAMIKEIITSTMTDEVHVQQSVPMWVLGVLLLLFGALIVCVIVIVSIYKNKKKS